MASDLLPLLVILLVVCCLALVWFYLDARHEQTQPNEINSDNRDSVIEMLSESGDHFSMSIYMKVYDIKISEIESRKSERRKSGKR